MKVKAHSIIDLVILLTAVGLLAAIAVPNLTDAESRTKLARGKSELRTAAVGLEAYAADHDGVFPYDGYNSNSPETYSYWFLPFNISTPVAYLQTNSIVDPYRANFKISSSSTVPVNDIRYVCIDSTWGTRYDSMQSGPPGQSFYYAAMVAECGGYWLRSAGPDGTLNPSFGDAPWPHSSYPSFPQPYDPTNGLLSRGDIIRTEKSEFGFQNMNP